MDAIHVALGFTVQLRLQASYLGPPRPATGLANRIIASLAACRFEALGAVISNSAQPVASERPQAHARAWNHGQAALWNFSCFHTHVYYHLV